MNEISDLIADLHDEQKASVAAVLLGNLGIAVLPNMLCILNNKSESIAVRDYAAWIIGKMRNQGLSAVADLTNCVADKTNPLKVRVKALWALSKMSNGVLYAMPVLNAILKDDADFEIHSWIKSTIPEILLLIEKFPREK
jgi:HEAT repeat protein